MRTKSPSPETLALFTERVLAAHGADVVREDDGVVRVDGTVFAFDRAALRAHPAAHFVAPGSSGFGRIVSLARALPGRIARATWAPRVPLEAAAIDAQLRGHGRVTRRTRPSLVLVSHVRVALSGERTVHEVLTVPYDVDLRRTLDDDECPPADAALLDEPDASAEGERPGAALLTRAADAVRAAVQQRMHRTVRRLVTEREEAIQKRLALLHGFYQERLHEEAARVTVAAESDGSVDRTRRLKEEWERKSHEETTRRAIDASIELLAMELWSVPRTWVASAGVTAVFDHATGAWLRIACARCGALTPLAHGQGRRCKRCAAQTT